MCKTKKKIELIECPLCKGKGTWECIATIIDHTGSHKAPAVNMPCHVCNSTGKVDPVKLEEDRKAEEAFWCSCGNPSGSVSFFEDGEGGMCAKHHYVCDDCGKVAQVG